MIVKQVISPVELVLIHKNIYSGGELAC